MTEVRNLHLVVPTIGRPGGVEVLREALHREARLSRLTVVSQNCPSVVDEALGLLAVRRGVVLSELRLAVPVGPAQARHLGANVGDEEFVGFLDDDISFVCGSLSDLVDRCERQGWGGACGVLHTPETHSLARALKAMLFWSVFRDPRQWASRRRRPVRSSILSGGMTVYQRTLYRRCDVEGTHAAGDDYGEDVELSFCASLHAPLAVDPAVRVRNRHRSLSVGPVDPTTRALRHLDRYRTFADRHATARRHWIAYVAVLAGVAARGAHERAGRRFYAAVARETGRALRQVVRQGRAAA